MQYGLGIPGRRWVEGEREKEMEIGLGGGETEKVGERENVKV